MLRKSLLILALTFCISMNVYAVELKFNGFIADEANLLSPQVENDLNMTLWDLQKKSGADVAVVTLKSLNGRTIEETAIDIGRTYKLGAVGKNNGVVFLTALDNRKMRIELGTGLENKISMSILEGIRDRDILPYYKKNDYENGISRGTYMIAEAVGNAENVKVSRYGVCPQQITSSGSSRSSIPWWAWPIAIVISIFCPSRRGRFNSSSFGGFGGGGGFGGCGCSGSW